MTTIRALSWNVNGIRAVYKKGFLEWFNQAQPDILCLQETKAHAEQLPAALRVVDDYEAHFNAPVARKGYSGVAIYTRVKPEKVDYGMGVEEFDQEGRVLAADYGQFVLLNVYFPNGKASAERLDYKMRFYDAFFGVIQGLRQQGKHVVVCGDVNTAHREIDLARPKANEMVSGFLPIERAWIDKLLENGYVDTFRMFNQEPDNYTWWDLMTRARDRNVGWRIDYFFVNQAFAPHVTNACILPNVMGSDHCPVGIDITLDRD